ncbi:MAG TPA: hypothetical protein VMU67_06985 [Steroidobacteraceae bacterium]|nr:hypothetical protein [Steroidobacteraceae bacterium]
MVSRNSFLPLAIAVAAVTALVARADPAPFDLAGPTLRVTVARGAQTLPISEVPNLAVGDRLAIQPDFPPSETARYLMVAAILGGATNPPPPNWFFRCDTWRAGCRKHGITVTIPEGAEQVLIFLAPKTGGDYRTLLGAVRGRPGAFVRTSQDLNQATLDRSRLDAYLAAIRALKDSDPTRLKEAVPLLARSLAIKVNEKCLDRIPELQVPCLTDGQGTLILDDGHSTSIAEALTSGAEADLITQVSLTPQLRFGYYSPYIGSVIDIARIMSSFSTAQYQYIPAVGSFAGDRIELSLNTPPSFHDPKSVLVAALPAIEQPQLPPLHAVDPKEIYCARKGSLVLPVEGAPLVFSTGYAHAMTLDLEGAGGKKLELAAKADPERGGFVIDTAGLGAADLGDSIRGSVEGYWGFEPYVGPTFQLTNAHVSGWQLDAADEGALIVGRQDTVHLRAASISCIDGIMLRDPDGKELKVDWKSVKPDEVEVQLPLKEVAPGSMTLLVRQFGASEPQPVPLRAFAEAGHLDSFTLHAGDAAGTLKGSRLDEVERLAISGFAFTPAELTTTAGTDELTMTSLSPQVTSAFKFGDSLQATVTLKDGRTLRLRTRVEAPRPSVALIGTSVEPSTSSSDSNIQLAAQDELPQDARLTFSVRALWPVSFTRDEAIEVATADESASSALTFANGGITLVDSRVAVATLDTAHAFGESAFGPLKFRVSAAGVTGAWQPLATLVRLPVLSHLKCPAGPQLACSLTGRNLYLVDAISDEPSFGHAVKVPDGFPGYVLPVPHPRDGELYVKLRDDPTVINLAAFAEPSPPPEQAAPAPSRAEHEEPQHHVSAESAASSTLATGSSPSAAHVPAARSSPIASGTSSTSSTSDASRSPTTPALAPPRIAPAAVTPSPGAASDPSQTTASAHST